MTTTLNPPSSNRSRVARRFRVRRRSLFIVGILIGALVAGSVACDPGEPAAPERFTVELQRFANARIAAVGTAPVPDGTWVHVEVLADPERLGGLYADAVPVAGGRFVLVTPFTQPFVYHAAAVLSPRLNPSLASVFAALPEDPGVETRGEGDRRELAARVKTAFGSPQERHDAHQAVIAEARSRANALRKDLDAVKSAPTAGLAGAYRTFDLDRRHVRDQAPERLLYAPDLAGALGRFAEAIDDLFRRRLAADSAERVEEAAKAALARAKAVDRLIDQRAEAVESEF